MDTKKVSPEIVKRRLAHDEQVLLRMAQPWGAEAEDIAGNYFKSEINREILEERGEAGANTYAPARLALHTRTLGRSRIYRVRSEKTRNDLDDPLFQIDPRELEARRHIASHRHAFRWDPIRCDIEFPPRRRRAYFDFGALGIHEILRNNPIKDSAKGADRTHTIEILTAADPDNPPHDGDLKHAFERGPKDTFSKMGRTFGSHSATLFGYDDVKSDPRYGFTPSYDIAGNMPATCGVGTCSSIATSLPATTAIITPLDGSRTPGGVIFTNPYFDPAKYRTTFYCYVGSK